MRIIKIFKAILLSRTMTRGIAKILAMISDVSEIGTVFIAIKNNPRWLDSKVGRYLAYCETSCVEPELNIEDLQSYQLMVQVNNIVRFGDDSISVVFLK